jgi:tetrapyrrole methylase family protein/MazG family protein
MTVSEHRAPHIDVVGLGPAGPELITAGALALMDKAAAVFLRTRQHPSAIVFGEAPTFDHHYERADTFDEVYRAIADDLVDAARRSGLVAYAVPGSPMVAERSVSLLKEHPAVIGGEVSVTVHPAVSFLDLSFARLGIDPMTSGVRMVDGESFAIDAAGERGPLLVAQCWSPATLSDIKLSVESMTATSVTVLHHLGLADERVFEVDWEDLDRAFTPDHLTSLWIPHLAAPVAAELVQLDELVHALRLRCPWDREQTHGSLARHLLEETYEVLEAIDALAAIDAEVDVAIDQEDGVIALGLLESGTEERAVADLEEELGDLLFQVYFHATLAAEAGRFTLADVARGVHDKLVSRHPHVFGDVVAETPEDVATNWEALKKTEKGRASVTEGIPKALPSLALAAKLQRKALAVGMELPTVADEIEQVTVRVRRLALDGEGADGEGGDPAQARVLGELLFSLANVARALGVDPETALRSRTTSFREAIEEVG